MKWIKRILIGLLLVIAIVCIAAYFWLNGTKPQYEGNLKLSGLSEKIDVYFDEYGVPHIYAQNKHDLYLAFGYIHAQDRLFQMEMLRRAGSGRLAEIIGRPLLKVDKMFRTLGLVEYAKESAAYLETQKGTPMYTDIQAYLEGVNYFVSKGATPPEFSIIGIEKTAYTIEDLYYITGAMSFSFSQAQKTEPVIDFISKKYGDQYLKDMGLWHDPKESYIRTNVPEKKSSPSQEGIQATESVLISANSTYEKTSSDVPLKMAQLMSELEEILPFAPLEGSNSWVVAGSKTKSGEVLFCNDTHIGYLLPQTWYEAHLNAPDFEMYGHFLAGVPYALIGRNRSLSWGVTMLLNDDMDFYIEKTNPQNPDQYIYRGEAKDYQKTQHVIKIKGETDTTIEIRSTIHGPVINDAFDGMSKEHPLSMFWTYTKLPNRTVDALHGLNNSITMNDFQSYLPLIHAPGLNINYGDAAGNIAWWGCASLIDRPPHVNSWTMLDGASGEDDSKGYYDFNKNPKCINPTWGYIYSANDWPQAIENAYSTDEVLSDTGNNVLTTYTSLWYPGYYKPQYRADRIRSLLEQNNNWSMTTIQEVMTDHKNISDSLILQGFRKVLTENSRYNDSTHFRQFDELFNWDGSYSPISTSPALFNKMLYHYLHDAMADELGEERFGLFLQTHQLQRTQQYLFDQKDSPWWDVKGTSKIETRSDIIYMAYCKSIEALTKQLGGNPKIWTWRKVASLELKHPLGEVAALRPMFNVGPEEIYGGNETILQSGFKLDSTGEYKILFGSQMRIIVDFANVDSSLNVTPCGQSGHIMSKHYQDQAKMYRELKFRTQWMSRKRIEQFEHLELKQ